jgi:septum formation protein
VAEKYPFTITRRLLLASTSRHRKTLLERLRLPFDSEAPEVDETRAPGETPRAQAVRLALAKAMAVASRHPGALVIGSDQVCALGDTVLGKPGTAAANRDMLATLSGQTATFHTAVAIVGLEDGLRQEHVDDTLCNFRPLTSADIARYVEAEPSLDCAGGFKSEGLGVTLMSSVYSRDPTGLVGLPLIWVAEVIRPFLRPAAG